ncbi:uncharacterized protein N7469_005855 [Penicillium citrinum]|uniref:Cytochrome c oxidase polypeptide VIIA n=1 Tax=Penicillium citrinum TaxID=5077 RepID=A0A9W9P2D9_PENCI|nr:uncharacterized protein N7469_005855 [Penicillium citrinum]KAJ5234089.1 hypothetical protein N7469_005855 [Penicillium citrinum]
MKASTSTSRGHILSDSIKCYVENRLTLFIRYNACRYPPPITGMLRRGLVLDLSTAFGFGTTFGYLWWYGFHLPRVRERDAYYARLEQERAAQRD